MIVVMKMNASQRNIDAVLHRVEEAGCQVHPIVGAVLNHKLMENVIFEVLVVDDLPVNERTGKFQLIVQQPN